MDNSTHRTGKREARRDAAPAGRLPSCAALLKALQQLGMVDQEFNILPPPNWNVPDAGKPH